MKSMIVEEQTNIIKKNEEKKKKEEEAEKIKQKYIQAKIKEEEERRLRYQEQQKFFTKPCLISMLMDIVDKPIQKNSLPPTLDTMNLGFVSKAPVPKPKQEDDFDWESDEDQYCGGGMGRFELLKLAGDVEANPGPLNKRIMSKTQRKKKPRRRTMGPVNRHQTQDNAIIRLPRPTLYPNEKIEMLTFELMSTPFNNPGGPIVVEELNLNDAYDWLTTILTASQQGLNTMFVRYGFAKVISIRMFEIFDNLEQTALDMFFFTAAKALLSSFPNKEALGYIAATGLTRWRDEMSEQYGKKSQVCMQKKLVPWRALGNKAEYFGQNDYAFTQSSNPAKVIKGAWVASTPLNSMTNGFTRRTIIQAKILFYDANILGSPTSTSTPTYRIPENRIYRSRIEDEKPPHVPPAQQIEVQTTQYPETNFSPQMAVDFAQYLRLKTKST